MEALWDCAAGESIRQAGPKRMTGRVAVEVRSTHFQSSVMIARRSGPGYTSSIELSRPARLTFRRLFPPGCTRMFSRTAGRKLASVTRTA